MVSKLRNRWILSKAGRVHKKLVLIGMNFLHSMAKKFLHEPENAAVKEWYRLFDALIKFEDSKEMRKRWMQFRDLSSLLLDEDGAYRIRWLLLMWLIYKNYEKLKPNYLEAYLLAVTLRKRGMKKEASALFEDLNKLVGEKHEDGS